jgi:hypothetical protein
MRNPEASTIHRPPSINLRSPWAAVAVGLITAIVCALGVRAELASPHVATARSADQACGADPANGC